VPISPAFHYAIGGIKTALDGKVPSVTNLYAVGEVASTRVHGANRLASNSLREGLVFAKKASMSILKDNDEKIFEEFEVEDEIMSYKEDKAKKNELRQIMWQDVSIMRTKGGLLHAKNKIALLLKQNIGKLLKFRLLTAKEIVNRAISRDKSIGVHTIQEEE
jgi:L-aspartate oxidase